jgi:glycosyltransferase involved in cell wall biosynthesis
MEKEKPRILHVIDTTKPGGAQELIKHLVTGMIEDTELFVAVLGEKGGYSNAFRKAGAIVFDIGSGSDRWGVFVIFRLIKVIRETQPNIIHAHLFKSLILSPIASLIASTKCIIHDHTGMYDDSLIHYMPMNIIRKSYLLAYRGVLAICDQVLVLTNEMRDVYYEIYKMPRKKIAVVPNGIDVAHFSNESRTKLSLLTQYNLPENTIIIIMVGRLAAEKDWITFIDIAKKRQSAEDSQVFLIVGDGSQETILREYVLRQHLNNVLFLGHRSDVRDLLKQADVFVLTSKREPFGIVLLEAMAARCPVVASKSGGPEAIIQHEHNGMLVDVGDPDGFAWAINNILKNKTMRENLVENAFHTALEHDIHNYVDHVATIYDDMIS